MLVHIIAVIIIVVAVIITIIMTGWIVSATIWIGTSIHRGTCVPRIWRQWLVGVNRPIVARHRYSIRVLGS